MPGLAQGLEEVLRAERAGVQVIAVDLDHAAQQLPRDGIDLVLRQKLQHERQRERRLAPAAAHVLQRALDRGCDLRADGLGLADLRHVFLVEADGDAVLPDKGADERGPDARCVRGVGPFRVPLAEHARDLRGDGQGVVVEPRGDEEDRRVVHRADVQRRAPVGEAFERHQTLVLKLREPGEPAGHHAIVFLKHAAVAVVEVEIPRDQHACRAIVRVGRAELPIDGREIPEAAVGILRGAHVVEVFAEELVHVEVVDRLLRKQVCRAEPAEAFVLLRAVGRDAHQVAQLAPDHVAVDLVDELVRTLEAARPRNGRVDEVRGEIRDLGLALDVDLRIAEAVIGEARLVADRAGLAEDVDVLSLHDAVEQEAERAVAVHQLGMADGDPAAGLAGRLKADTAGEILPEVVDRAVRTGRIGLADTERRAAGDLRERRLRDEDVLRIVDRAGAEPSGVVEARRGPAALFQPCVVDLAVIVVVVDERPVADAPVFAGADGHGRAVRHPHAALQQEDRGLAEAGRDRRAALVAADVRFTPGEQAVAQHDAEHVLTRAEIFGHVVGGIERLFGKIGAAGVERGIADLLAVEV